MGILTSITDQKLDEARKNLVSEDLVCPACAAPFATTKETLSAVNPELGMRMHTCPACGHEIWSVALPG